jgi:hypothetical protein
MEEALRKAREFADSVYEDKEKSRAVTFHQELSNLSESSASKGLATSSPHSLARAGARARRIDELVQAKLNGLLEWTTRRIRAVRCASG